MMKCQALLPQRYRLLRFLHPVVAELRGLSGSSAVAWRRRKLLCTVAAREVPSSDRSRKRLSREERKALVEAYVSDYRMMNGGKFPTRSDTKKQVGGCYYVVRDILQELEYNSKLPNMAMKDENQVARRINKVKGVSALSTKEVNGISEVGVVLNNEVLDYRTSVSNECGILADDGSSGQGEVSDNSGQTKADTSLDTNNNKMSTEYDSSIADNSAKHKVNGFSESGGIPDSEVVGTTIVPSDNEISSDDCFKRQGELSNHTYRTMVDTSIATSYNKISAKDETLTGCNENPEFPSKSGHHLEAPNASKNTKLETIEDASSQAYLSDQLTREKSQNEPKKTSLWGNLKSFASSIISILQK